MMKTMSLPIIENEQIVEVLAPNSCTHCRRTHKKCDKKLPGCSLCNTRGRQCVYESVGKRGPKGHAEYHRPYPIASPKETSPVETRLPISQNYESVVRDPSFCMKIAFDMPVMSKNEMDTVLDYITAELRGVSYLLPKPDLDSLALAYSMQAGLNMCYGRREAAQYMFEKGRALLAEKFEDVLENFIVAVSFCFLALYCGNNGELERAHFFILNVRTFIENKCNSVLGKHPCYDFLVHMYHVTNNSLNGELDIEFMLKEYLNHHFVIRDHYLHSKGEINPMIAQVLNTDLDVLEIDKLRSDVAQRTRSYDLDNNKTQIVLSTLSNMYDRMQSAGMSEKMALAKKVYISFFVFGANLQRSMRNGAMPEAREAADTIARMTATPEFGSMSTASLPVLCLAAKAHLEFSKQTYNLTELLSLAERMREELLTFISISEKTKLIKMRCDPLVNELSQELRRIDEMIMMSRFDTFLTKPLEPFPTYSFSTANYLGGIKGTEASMDSLSSANDLLVPIETSPSLSLEDELLTFDAVDMFFKDFVDA
jgi:hypothetical protein